MRNLILLLISITWINTAEAQLRFKKIYPQAMASSKEEAYDIFLEFQRQNPNHVNNYYQLGKIALHWMFEYDPLVSFKDVSKHCYNARLYIGLARHKLTERDVRKYREYFQGIQPMIGDKLEFTDVKNYLDSTYALVELYEEKTAKINTYFNRSIDLYNTCVDQYMLINNRNARLKDMVLTIDKATIKEARLLKQNYDSALIYFQRYSNEVSTYDLVKYNQKLNIHPITTYRLEGMSQQNFLKPQINIYDYGTWVDQLFHVLDNEIVTLRKAILEADKQFDTSLTQLQNPSFIVEKETPLFRFEDKLKYQIGKFDNNSLVVDWFDYRDAQINLFAKARSQFLNPNDSTPYSLLRRVKVFEEFIEAKAKADKQLKHFESRIIESRIKKYPTFFGSNYQGQAGLKSTAQNQQRINNELANMALIQLDSFRRKEVKQFITTETDFTFRRLKIPQPDTISLAKLKNNKYKTTDVKITQDNGIYIVGLHKINSNVIKPYVAFSSDGKNIDWLRKLNLKGIRYSDTIMVRLLPKGCAVMVHGNSRRNTPAINMVVRLDEFGNEQTKTILQTGNIPHDFIFDDINETILSVFKGESWQSIEQDKYQIYFNKTNGESIWSAELPVIGTPAGVIKMDQNFLVFSNFTQYNDGANTHQSGTTGYNTCSTTLDNQGKTLNWEKYLFPNPIEITNILKLNSNSINLLGFSKPNTSEEKFIYILIDAEGQLKYKN